MNLTSIQKYKYILIIAIVVIFILVIFSFFSSLFSNNPNTIINPTITPTTSTVISETPINKVDFSGFHSNTQIYFDSMNNLNSTLSVNNLPVLYSKEINKDYIVQNLNLTKDSLGNYKNTDYTLAVLPDGTLEIDYNKSLIIGSLSLYQATSIGNNFLKDKLKIDSSNFNLSTNKVGNEYRISVNMKTSEYNIVKLDNNPAAFIDVSTSGQIIDLYIYQLLYQISNQNNYQLSIVSPVQDTTKIYNVGVYVNLGKNISDNIPLYTHSINATSAQISYYFDSQTGYIFPVLKSNISFNAYNKGNDYTGIMLLSLIQSQYITTVIPTQAKSTGHGYTQN